MNTSVYDAVNFVRKKYNVTELPVNLTHLADKAGIQIRYGDFEEETSGFAYRKATTKYIGVNASESDVRQRFTIAHELGHMFMHQQDPISYDPSVGLIHFRDVHSSTGELKKEREANAFAAELLMPKEIVINEVNEMNGIDLHDLSALSRLADKFGVSHAAITVRLASIYDAYN